MTTQQAVAAIAIHLLVPLAGIALFAWLYRLMIKSSISEPPIISLLLLFITIGGWLFVALTTAFWQWSGMASLGVFFLVLVAPWLTLGSAFRLRRHRDNSLFHRWVFRFSTAYTGLMLALVVGLIIWNITGFERGTKYASQKAKVNWEQIQPGMTKDQVIELLGNPLGFKVEWGFSDVEQNLNRILWAMPKNGYGYFQCIWFDGEKVVKKERWKDD